MAEGRREWKGDEDAAINLLKKPGMEKYVGKIVGENVRHRHSVKFI